jgi:hypothetical protein
MVNGEMSPLDLLTFQRGNPENDPFERDLNPLSSYDGIRHVSRISRLDNTNTTLALTATDSIPMLPVSCRVVTSFRVSLPAYTCAKS